MTKITQDFQFWTGEDKSIVYTVTDSTGASVSLSSYTAHWLLQDEPDSGSLIKLKTGGSGVVCSGCTATVTLAASHTSGCNLNGLYYVELSACDSASNRSVLAVGQAQIHRSGY